MPKKSKKFIDKKNAVSFHVVHRSQQDPLTADESAPQHVLVPLQDPVKIPANPKDRVEEQKKFGIFYDDDYNYLQHLRDINNTTEWVPVGTGETICHKERKLQLPSSVFASNVEEEIGLLNKAAPSGLRLDLDADVIAALDEDFDFDDPNNMLDDNFMEFANATDDSANEDSDDMDSDEARDEIASLNDSQFSFGEEETKSRFTDYSMSSSVIRRNNQLSLLDDRFEQMYSAYDDTEIGALDCEEIEGDVSETENFLKTYAEEFSKLRLNDHLDKDAIALRVRLQQECGTSSDEDDLNLVTMRLPEKEKWDCESILTTYSNIYNHPKLIIEPKNSKIKIDSKTGIPKNVLNSKKLTANALRMLDDENNGNRRSDTKSVGAKSAASMISTLSVRNKHESLDEKIKRKRLLKEYRKERREEKKLNKKAFTEENIRQSKININNCNNVQGNRIL